MLPLSGGCWRNFSALFYCPYRERLQNCCPLSLEHYQVCGKNCYLVSCSPYQECVDIIAATWVVIFIRSLLTEPLPLEWWFQSEECWQNCCPLSCWAYQESLDRTATLLLWPLSGECGYNCSPFYFDRIQETDNSSAPLCVAAHYQDSVDNQQLHESWPLPGECWQNKCPFCFFPYHESVNRTATASVKRFLGEYWQTTIPCTVALSSGYWQNCGCWQNCCPFWWWLFFEVWIVLWYGLKIRLRCSGCPCM